jgi:hypothetical protein
MIIKYDELNNLLESFGEHFNKSILSYGNPHLLFDLIDDFIM